MAEDVKAGKAAVPFQGNAILKAIEVVRGISSDLQ